MRCFECKQAGKISDAVGLCHHCSVALCPDHAVMTSEPVLGHAPILKEVTLPKNARMLLCSTCKAAMAQSNSQRVA
jgi:hypothetical protein